MTGCCAKCGPIQADELIWHATQCYGAQQWPDGGLAFIDRSLLGDVRAVAGLIPFTDDDAAQLLTLARPTRWSRLRARIAKFFKP